MCVGGCRAECWHEARRKSKSGLPRGWTWGFVCKVGVLSGQAKPCPLTSGRLRRVMACCREHVFMDFSQSRALGVHRLLSHAGFVSFDKHDLLSVNMVHSVMFFLFYMNFCLRGERHYSDESHVWLSNERCLNCSKPTVFLYNGSDCDAELNYLTKVIVATMYETPVIKSKILNFIPK